MKRAPRHLRGQALVEFALILPVLMLILLGVVDGGRMIYAYNAVSNAAREAGRTAIINQDFATIRSKAAQQATGLSLPTGEPPNCPTAGGPEASPVPAICVAIRSADTLSECDPAKIGCSAIVSVQWLWQPITPVIGNIIGHVRLESTTRQQIESVCPRAGVTDCPGR